MTLRLNGSTSGYVELDAPAVAGTTALTLPATAGTVATQAYADTAGSTLGGLVHITTQSFSSVSSVSLNDCFTSAYDNYRMIITMTAASANLAIRARTRLAGSDDTGTNYFRSAYYIGTTGAAAGSDVGGNLNYWVISDASDSTDANNMLFLDIYGPLNNKRKNMVGMGHQQNPSAVGYGYSLYFNKTATTNYDGMTFFTSTGTASFTVRVYGYLND